MPVYALACECTWDFLGTGLAFGGPDCSHLKCSVNRMWLAEVSALLAELPPHPFEVPGDKTRACFVHKLLYKCKRGLLGPGASSYINIF